MNSMDDHERASRLEGAEFPGDPGSYPSTPAEFAARWNERTEAERADLLARINTDAEDAMRRITSARYMPGRHALIVTESGSYL